MAPRAPDLAKLLIAAASLAACSFDASRLRGRAYQNPENSVDQDSGSDGVAGPVADGSPVPTPTEDADPQDTPSFPADVRLPNDVFTWDRAGPAVDGSGGAGGAFAFDAQTSPPDALAIDGTGGAGGSSTGGAFSTGGTGGGGSIDTGGTSSTTSTDSISPSRAGRQAGLGPRRSDLRRTTPPPTPRLRRAHRRTGMYCCT